MRPWPPRFSRRSSACAAEKVREAGIAIVGGQTIQTEEPIFGLAVVGRVHPGEGPVITNAGARPGDFLILTKPSAPASSPRPPSRGEDSSARSARRSP